MPGEITAVVEKCNCRYTDEHTLESVGKGKIYCFILILAVVALRFTPEGIIWNIGPLNL